jgi:PAP2 superfamily
VPTHRKLILDIIVSAIPAVCIGCASVSGSGQAALSAGSTSTQTVIRAASDEPIAQIVLLGEPEPVASEDGPTRSSGDSQGTQGSASVACLPVPDWGSDKADFLDVFCSDIEALCTRENALTLVVAGGVSLVFHETLDDDVADYTSDHPNRWGKIQDAIGGIGNPLHHLAFASGLYVYSLMEEDGELHEFSRSLFNATAITAVSTTLLKFAANTERPNGDPRGWPSGHTASSFAFAAVLDEYYGHWIGIPAYALSGLVAWERIDDREHDLSDVVFGAAMGYVIGRTVASQHRARFCGFQVEPYMDPATGANGVGLERHF